VTKEREQRFRRLYEQRRAPLLAYALRRTRSPEDAADVVAETFAIAWRKLDDVPAGERAAGWLYGTARGVIANTSRKTVTRSALVQRLGAELSCGEQVVEQAAVREPTTVAKAMAFLSEGDREVLMLAAWEGLRSTELSQALGCSPVAARLRLHRARARLRARLSSETSAPDFAHRRGPDPFTEVDDDGRAPVIADG
jgi:RNA polymerase sigma factor (sigma-70 family)